MSAFLNPTPNEFAEPLLELCGEGLLSDAKQKLVPLALAVIRGSLLSRRPPNQFLQSLHDSQCQDLLRRPRSASLVSDLLDQITSLPELRGVIAALAQPAIRQQLKIEWLYEMTLARFEHAFPFLKDEEERLAAWKDFCDAQQEISFNPHREAENRAHKTLSANQDKLSDWAKRLYHTSFLAACRKLFVHLSGAKETWAGPHITRSFAADDPNANPGLSASIGHEKCLSMRFGHVEHVFYVKPTLVQMQLYLAYIGNQTLMRIIQLSLCPFVSSDCREMNLLAEIFYGVFLIAGSRGNCSEEAAVNRLQDQGINHSFLKRFGFLPLNSQLIGSLTDRLNAEPRLHAFLHHPRTESGLTRQRLYRGIIAPMLDELVEQCLCELCRQWNPVAQSEEGVRRHLISIVEGRSSVVADDVRSADRLRQSIECGELFKILDRNTQAWTQELNRNGFVVDRERLYFMTVLEKAKSEYDSEEDRREEYTEVGGVACVVVQ
jgi:hypothetical protein